MLDNTLVCSHLEETNSKFKEKKFFSNFDLTLKRITFLIFHLEVIIKKKIQPVNHRLFFFMLDNENVEVAFPMIDGISKIVCCKRNKLF
jgi:hypothetical protein